MATLEINGQRVQIDDAFKSLSPEEQQATVEEIARELGIGAQGSSGMDAANAELSAMTQGIQDAPKEEADLRVRANLEATKQIGAGNGGAGQAVGDFVDRAIMDGLPFVDEAYSATIGNVGRMMRDGVGPVEAYKREHALQEAISKKRYERSPVASTAGMLAGTLATGGGLYKAGMLAPGMSKLGNAGQLAAFGGVTGLSQGEGTDRLKNATVGAVTAPIVGGLLNKGGQMVSKALAPKAPKAIPASEQLAQEARGIYEAAYKSGTAIKANETSRIVDNLQLVAGRINDKLRPKTAGLLDDVQALKGKPWDVQTFHELRRQIGGEIARAEPDDARTLTRMKELLDKWAEKAPPSAMTNGKQGLDLLKQANEVYSRSAKTAKIEQLTELAKLKTGNFTQAGEARAISQQAQGLARDIIKNGSQGFKPDEIALLNKIAMGETSGKATRFVSKFAPRGVVSAGGTLGTAGLATAVGGPVLGGTVAAAVPAAGWAAAKSVDKAAMNAIQQLEQMVASGNASPAMKKAAAKMLGYTPGVAMATTKLGPVGSEQRR